jgi:S-adenosylmethionine synthetase
MKGKKKIENSSSSSKQVDDEEDQPSTSSFEDEDTIWRVRNVMRMIHKINLMGVPLQVEDIFLTLTWRNKEKGDASHLGRRDSSGIISQTRSHLWRGGAKAKYSL